MTLTTERLEEMRRGLEGVTPGPWEAQGTEWEGEERGSNFIVGSRQQGIVGAAHAFPTEFESGDFDRVDANAAHIARCDPDTIRSMIDELLERRSLDKGEVVKPLEWLSDNFGHMAESILGVYWVRNPYSNGQVELQGSHERRFYRSQDEAKAAAQADYETRIRSALASQPTPKGVDEMEAGS